MAQIPKTFIKHEFSSHVFMHIRYIFAKAVSNPCRSVEVVAVSNFDRVEYK